MTTCRALLPILALALAASLPEGLAVPPEAGARTAAAPESPGRPDPALATRVFSIRHKSVDDVYLLLSPYLGPRGSIRAQPHQRTLTVTDSLATLNRMTDLVVAYDVPPRSVQVSVQLIMASAGGGSAEPVPPPIRGVIEKLNALNTRWNDYRLVGDVRVLGTEGERSTLRVGDDYRIDFRIDQVSDESRVIRFKPFELARREPAEEGNERYAPILNTVLNLKDSQLFIVGASKMERSNRALFMTITASLQQP
jgi:hypothetical protein